MGPQKCDGMMWKLGAAEDNARFIRERAQALSPEEGLTIFEELRAMTYDDPEAPPRLERVFVLSRGPRGPAVSGSSLTNAPLAFSVSSISSRRSGHVAGPRLCSISSSCVRQACCPRSRASDVGPRGGARRGPETFLAEGAPMDREVSGGL